MNVGDTRPPSTDNHSPLSITVYSDYICPWCYVGAARIKQLQRNFDLAVEWRPFELHPETPRDGGSLAGRLGSSERARAYVRNLRQLTDDAGLPFAQPPRVANSHLALEAAEFAREHGGFEPYHDALFHAYFGEGRDIGDAGVLCDIARECGVDDQHLRQALADERYAARIDEITAEARASEVLSTPTFVFSNGFQLVGAQDYEVFASIITRIRRVTGN